MSSVTLRALAKGCGTVSQGQTVANEEAGTERWCTLYGFSILQSLPHSGEVLLLPSQICALRLVFGVPLQSAACPIHIGVTIIGVANVDDVRL